MKISFAFRLTISAIIICSCEKDEGLPINTNEPQYLMFQLFTYGPNPMGSESVLPRLAESSKIPKQPMFLWLPMPISIKNY
jgi:hypothetical protein